MEYKVFGEKDETATYFTLIKEDRCIILAAVDERGKLLPSGRVVEILPTGQLHRIIEVSDEIGLPLDELGRIELSQ